MFSNWHIDCSSRVVASSRETSHVQSVQIRSTTRFAAGPPGPARETTHCYKEWPTVVLKSSCTWLKSLVMVYNCKLVVPLVFAEPVGVLGSLNSAVPICILDLQGLALPTCVCVWNIWTDVKLLFIIKQAGGHGSIHQSVANEATDVWRGYAVWSTARTCIYHFFR